MDWIESAKIGSAAQTFPENMMKGLNQFYTASEKWVELRQQY